MESHQRFVFTSQERKHTLMGQRACMEVQIAPAAKEFVENLLKGASVSDRGDVQKYMFAVLRTGFIEQLVPMQQYIEQRNKARID